LNGFRVVETLGETEQGEQGAIEYENSRSRGWKCAGTKERRWVVADCELQHDAQVAYGREAKNDKKKVCAGLTNNAPTLAVEPKCWEKSFGE
jgi:hypothetical protein